MENWKDIKGYEGLYQVSDHGDVRSVDRVTTGNRNRRIKGKVLKKTKSTTGYFKVELCKDGRAISTKVHRIVAKAFIRNPYGKPHINHIDNNPLNNMVENLEWCTRSYNLQYNGRAKRVGIVQGKAVEQWTLDGNLVKTFETIRQAEAETGIRRQSISGSCRQKYGCKTAGGYRWKYKQ